MPTARYTSRVSTRATGAQVSAANDNAVEDRILQLSEDIWNTRAVSPAAFTVMDGADVADIVKNASSPNYLTSIGGATTARLVEAGLDLPHASTWTDMVVHGNIQTSTSSYVKVSFYKIALADGTSTQIGTDCTLTGATGDGNASVTFAGETIDNTSYSYKLRCTLYNHTGASQARLYGVKLS